MTLCHKSLVNQWLIVGLAMSIRDAWTLVCDCLRLIWNRKSRLDRSESAVILGIELSCYLLDADLVELRDYYDALVENRKATERG